MYIFSSVYLGHHSKHIGKVQKTVCYFPCIHRSSINHRLILIGVTRHPDTNENKNEVQLNIRALIEK